APAPKFHTLLAQRSNSGSWVTPRSSVIASNLVRPGDLWEVDGSPPSRCSTTSVERFSDPTLLTPATYRPSHFTRNLKFLYGSRRCELTVNLAILRSSYEMVWPANCWSLMTTNSAGLSAAKPTTMLTMPRLVSVSVVVSLSHLTKYASRRVCPAKAPCRN